MSGETSSRSPGNVPAPRSAREGEEPGCFEGFASLPSAAFRSRRTRGGRTKKRDALLTMRYRATQSLETLFLLGMPVHGSTGSLSASARHPRTKSKGAAVADARGRGLPTLSVPSSAQTRRLLAKHSRTRTCGQQLVSARISYCHSFMLKALRRRHALLEKAPSLPLPRRREHARAACGGRRTGGRWEGRIYWAVVFARERFIGIGSGESDGVWTPR